MKKVILLICCVLLLQILAVPAFAADTLHFHVEASAEQVSPGDLIVFTVSVQQSAKCTSFLYIPEFDADVLEMVDGACLVEGALLKDFSKTDGVVVLFEEETAYRGKVCSFTLRVKNGAKGGNTVLTGEYAAQNAAGFLDVSADEVTITVRADAQQTPQTTEATLPSISVDPVIPAVPGVTPAPDEKPQETQVATEQMPTETAQDITITIGALPQDAEQEQEPQTPKFPLWILILSVLVVLAAAVLFMFLGKKNK